MKRRLLAIFLSLTLMLSLVPSAWAVENEESSQEAVVEEPETELIEGLQARINALPDAAALAEMDEDALKAVYNEVQTIYDALDALSTEAVEALELTPLETAAAFFTEQVAPLDVSAGTVVSENTTWNTATTLTEDLTVNSGATLTIGAQVTISGDVTVSGGGTIKRGEDFADYMIVVPEGSTLTLKNITVDGGAVWSGTDDTTLNRGTTNSGITATSAMIYNFGKLLVTDGAVLQNNDNTTNTGAIATKNETTGEYTYPTVGDKVQFGGAVLNGGEMKIAGGSIQNNSVAWRGAGVASYGIIEMTDGTVQGNFAQNRWGDGGAFYLHGAKNTSEEGSAYCTISGGQLAANKAGGAGGAVCADGQSILNVSGGSFVGNVATTTGGGINVYSSILNMSAGTISGNSADQGGGLNLIMGSKATITGGHITSNKAQSGGGVQVADSSELDASNLVIEKNEATNNGGGIYAPGAVNKAYRISLNGVSVKDNKAGTGSENGGVGGGICASRAWREESSTGTLTLTNSKITGNRGVNGGGIYLDAGITATMDGGEISGNSAISTGQSSGGGIWVKGTFTLNSGKISNNVKDGQWNGGAGAFVSGTFTMNGGEVSGNIDTCTAAEERTIGGGAFYVMGGTLNIHGGSIMGNASYRGGAITFHNGPYARGTVNITGGTITGNYCTSGDGGAIYMPTAKANDTQIFDQTVKISGNPVITGNYKGATITSNGAAYTINPTNDTTENNIYLGLNQKNGTNAVPSEYAARQTIVLGELTNGASIGVTTETSLAEGRKVQITSAETDTKYYKDAARYFIPDAANVIAQANESDNYVELAYTADNYHKVTLNLRHASATGGLITQVKDGKSYSVAVTADTGYTLPATLADVDKYDRLANNQTANIVINSVTTDRTIAIDAVPNTYIVVFNGNGSTGGAMETQSMTYDATDKLTANAYTKTGCNFAGWSTTKNGTCEYPDKASVKNLTAENGGTVTLYAIWTEKTPIPKFDDGNNAIQSYKYDGKAKQYALTSKLEGFNVSYQQNGQTVTPKNVGTYDVIISRAENATYAAFSQTITDGLVITAADYPVTVSADRTAVTGGGAVKLTASSSVEGITVTGITCSDPSITVTSNGGGSYSVILPGVTKTYTFTAEVAGNLSNYGNGPATCTVSVTAYYVPGAPTYPATAPAAPNGTVTVTPSNASKGTNVTVTVKPNEGYELGSLAVKDASGNLLPLTDLGNGKFSFVMPASKVSVEAEFVKTAATSFADVPANAYFADAVKWAVDKGITNGLSDTMFGPYESCTRAQIVTFLWRAAGSPEPKTASSFTDVPANAYYAKAVAWAVENGITNGMTETTFAPDATCTRGQSVTFLHRALKGNASGSTNFTDVKSDAFYADAINWAVANNVTNGTSNTTFSPNADCTRAEIVTFLYRAYQGK